MIRRYLVVGSKPELRIEQSKVPGTEEIELCLPIDVYWEMVEVIRMLRYSSTGEMASSRYWQVLVHLARPYIVSEQARVWFCKNIGAA